MKHLKYLKYIVRHKWFVFLECLKYGLFVQGIFHDWHKFLPREWFPYVNFFYGEKPSALRDETGYYKPEEIGVSQFDYAWFMHQKLGKHHWQWWILPCDDGEIKTIVMPDKYQKEMIADWRGAGRAQGTPDTLAWYTKNKNKLHLHPDTRTWIENEIGYNNA